MFLYDICRLFKLLLIVATVLLSMTYDVKRCFEACST